MPTLAKPETISLPVPPPTADPITGRPVYTLLAGGADTEYFRTPCNLPDGRIIAHGRHDGRPAVYLLAPGDRRVDVRYADDLGQPVRLRESDGTMLGCDGRAIVADRTAGGGQ